MSAGQPTHAFTMAHAIAELVASQRRHADTLADLRRVLEPPARPPLVCADCDRPVTLSTSVTWTGLGQRALLCCTCAYDREDFLEDASSTVYLFK